MGSGGPGKYLSTCFSPSALCLMRCDFYHHHPSGGEEEEGKECVVTLLPVFWGRAEGKSARDLSPSPSVRMPRQKYYFTNKALKNFTVARIKLGHYICESKGTGCAEEEAGKAQIQTALGMERPAKNNAQLHNRLWLLRLRLAHRRAADQWGEAVGEGGAGMKGIRIMGRPLWSDQKHF